MHNKTDKDSVDTTGIILQLLNDIVQRLEGLDGHLGKPSSNPGRNGSSITALVLVTLLLGLCMGAIIALMLSGCTELSIPFLFGAGSLFHIKPAQIKLVRREYYSIMVDKNDTVTPIDVGTARKLLTSMGYIKIEETQENGFPIETWQLPADKQTPC
jgi:hypothetical protein